MYFAKNAAYFSFNSWISFQQLCRLSWGYHYQRPSRRYASAVYDIIVKKLNSLKHLVRTIVAESHN